MKEEFLDFCQFLAEPNNSSFEKGLFFFGFCVILVAGLFLAFLYILSIIASNGLMLIPPIVGYCLYKVLVSIGKLNG